MCNIYFKLHFTVLRNETSVFKLVTTALNRMFQGKGAFMGNALHKALLRIGDFIQHKRSGMRSSTQVADYDSKVFAKRGTSLHIQVASKKKLQVHVPRPH